MLASSTFAADYGDALDAVLDAVRTTGKSAHPLSGEPYSPLVRRVAFDRCLSTVTLQAVVEAWADGLDRRVEDEMDAPEWDSGAITFDPYVG